jgi:hypothetical protein
VDVGIGEKIGAAELPADVVLPGNLPDFRRRNWQRAIENELVSCPKSRASIRHAERHDLAFGLRRLTDHPWERAQLSLDALHTLAHRSDDLARLRAGVVRRLHNKPILNVAGKTDDDLGQFAAAHIDTLNQFEDTMATGQQCVNKILATGQLGVRCPPIFPAEG